ASAFDPRETEVPMRARVPVLAAIALFVAGCTPTLFVQKVEDPSAASGASDASNQPRSDPRASASGDDGPSLQVTYPLAPDIARIAVLADKHPGRSAQVLAVFDL